MDDEFPLFEIKGHSYRVRPLPAKKALPVARFVLKAVGEAIAGVEDLEQEISTVIGKAMGNITDNDMTSLFDRLMPYCDLIEGDDSTRVDVIFNTHFAGRLGAATVLLGHAIKVNCGDFLDVLDSLPGMGPGDKAVGA